MNQPYRIGETIVAVRLVFIKENENNPVFRDNRIREAVESFHAHKEEVWICQ